MERKKMSMLDSVTINQSAPINEPVLANDSLLGDSISMPVDSASIDSLPIKHNFTFDSLMEMKQVVPSVNLKTEFRTQPIPDWIVVILVLVFVILAYIKTRSSSHVGNLISAMFNRSTLSKLYREKVASTIFNINFQLDLLFYINISIIIYCISCLYGDFPIKGLLLYLIIFIVSILAIETKMFIYKLIGNVFNGREATDQLLFCLFSGNRVAGLFLTPIVLISVILNDFIPEIILGLGIAITLFFYTNSLLKGLWIIAKKVLSVYYLILYLCTLEILPLLVVLKLLLNW